MTDDALRYLERDAHAHFFKHWREGKTIHEVAAAFAASVTSDLRAKLEEVIEANGQACVRAEKAEDRAEKAEAKLEEAERELSTRRCNCRKCICDDDEQCQGCGSHECKYHGDIRRERDSIERKTLEEVRGAALRYGAWYLTEEIKDRPTGEEEPTQLVCTDPNCPCRRES